MTGRPAPRSPLASTLVCACNRIREQEIREAIGAGANSLARLRAAMAVCDTCTACQAGILRLLEDERERGPRMDGSTGDGATAMPGRGRCD